MAGVERQLRLSVETQRRGGNLDDQQHVVGSGVALAVVIVARPQQRQVGLRLGVLAQPHRILNEHDGSPVHGVHENLGQVGDRPGVRTTGRRHVDDLAVDQLDTGLGIEDAHLRHAVVVVDGEPVTARQVGGGVRHGFTINPGRVRVNGDSP